MAHARRMFNEALENDFERASYALNEIQKLYTIERHSKEAGLSFDELKVVRSTEAAPILKGMELWMQKQYAQVLPKSAIGKALAYSIERWHKLSLYITDGRLNIDNNPVENSIRPVALGRKITCSPVRTTPPEEAACCTAYSAPAKCTVSNLMDG